jgi:hypothetical protein
MSWNEYHETKFFVNRSIKLSCWDLLLIFWFVRWRSEHSRWIDEFDWSKISWDYQASLLDLREAMQWLDMTYSYSRRGRNRCLINSTNERTKKSRFSDVINCTYAWMMFLRYKFIFEKTTMRHTIKRCWIRWIIKHWVNIKFMFWSLNVRITNRDFSNAFLISRCLISFTNRKLNMRISNDTSFLFIDWKTFFLMRSLIFLCLNAVNWKKAMCTIESNLIMTTKTSIEIETKTKAKARSRSLLVLNTKLKYAIDEKYFRERSRSRLNEFEKISNFDFWSIETTI